VFRRNFRRPDVGCTVDQHISTPDLDAEYTALDSQ
jgi:hypothetical protein